MTTISSSNNADVAQFYIPAGTLNVLGKSVDVCVKVTSTIVSTGIPTWTLKTSKQYLQSQVTLATLVFPTQTGAVTSNFCFSLQTTATGTSGTLMVSGDGKEAIQSSGVTVAAIDVNAAASSAVDLTAGQYFSLNLAMGTAGASGVTGLSTLTRQLRSRRTLLNRRHTRRRKDEKGRAITKEIDDFGFPFLP